jgi:SOS-response transcriptional repressor LexA
MLAQVHGVNNELKITRSQRHFYKGHSKTSVGYIWPMIESPIYQRIKQRLDELGMSERQASLKVSGNGQFIRNIRRGASQSPRGENIIKLAKVLGVSESWLMGTSDDEGSAPEERPFGVRFGGIVEAGAFRREDGTNQDAELRLIPLPPDPRYPASRQFAFQVMGDSMTEAKIFEGMHVLAVDVHAWERVHGHPNDGKLVVVARYRNGEAERELTIKRLRIFPDRMELRPESVNKAHQPIAFALPPRQDEEGEATIIAVVLSATWILT